MIKKSISQAFRLAAISLFCFTVKTTAATMTINSISGPVTAAEISSFKTFMQGESAPTAQVYNNNFADGTQGMEAEALGLMYEVTNDPALLNKMILYADAFLALRNDFTDKRVMWDGSVDPVWLTRVATDAQAGYAGCENNDIVGHIAYCARLILQTPSLWNAVVPGGDPHGYGSTYLERAETYIAQMDYTQDAYMLKWFVSPSNFKLVAPTSAAWTALDENVNAYNRQMMFLNGFQRLSECHQLLGDSPSRVVEYDAIVKAAINTFVGALKPYTTNGVPVYNWTYSPSQGGSEDNTLHSTYDIWGITRAWASGRYGVSAATLVPFANTLQYVMNVSTNRISYYVNGTSGANGLRTFIYPGWMPIANFGAGTFPIMANMDIAGGQQHGTAIYDAMILWVKNARYLGVYPTNSSGPDFVISTPWFQTASAGSNLTCTVTLNSFGGFSGSTVLSVSGLPSGVGASFNPAAINGGSGTSVLTLSISNSAAAGTFGLSNALVIHGVNSVTGISRSTTINLVVRREAASLAWSSVSDGTWDVANAENWFNPATNGPSQFYNGDNVLFDDATGVQTNILLNATVLPAAVTNRSSVNNFAISGAGKISGAGGVVKLGGSTLTINTTNDFTGGVMIGGGTLRVGNASALGSTSGTTVVASGGTLDINGFNLTAEPVGISGSGVDDNGAVVNDGASQASALRQVTLTGDVTFGGSSRWDIRNAGGVASLSVSPVGSAYNITKVGTNQVSLVGVTSIEPMLGDIDIQAGTFAIQTTTTQLGDASKTITVHGSATLDVWNLTAGPLNKKIVMQDGSTFFNESGTSTNAGPITLQGGGIFNIGGTALRCSGIIGGGGSLTKNGVGTLYLSAPDVYSGTTTVNAGTLAVTGAGEIAASANIFVAAGAALDVSGRSDETMTLAAGQMLSGGGIINGNLIENSGATVAPGTGLTGALTIQGNATLSGVTRMKLDRTASTNDVLQIGSALNYGGTLVLANLNGILAVGDSFKLFNALTYSGVFTNIIPAIPAVGLGWNTNDLAHGILNVVSAPTPHPEISRMMRNGNALTFSGTNGVPGWTYYILASTNLTLPLTQWTPVVRNQFDATGCFTNVLDSSGASAFYILKLQ